MGNPDRVSEFILFRLPTPSWHWGLFTENSYRVLNSKCKFLLPLFNTPVTEGTRSICCLSPEFRDKHLIINFHCVCFFMNRYFS